MATNYYNPFEKNEVEKGHWFLGSMFRLGALAGVAFGAYKMKGPTARLVSKYVDQQKGRILNNEMLKQIDNQDLVIGDHYRLQPDYFGVDVDDETQRALEELTDPNVSTNFDAEEARDRGILKKIKNAEREIVITSEEDISLSKIEAVRKNASMHKPLSQLNTHIDSDEVFFDLRESTLYEYFSREAGLREQDLNQLYSIKSPTSDKMRLKELHEYYLEHSSTYAELYNRRLQKLDSDFQMSRKAHNANVATPSTPDAAKRHVYGSENFLDEATSIARQRLYANELGQGYHRHDAEIINVFEFLADDNNKVTSGSLNRVAFMPNSNKRFALLSQFDYTPELKKLANQLDSLKGDRGGDALIKNVGLDIIPKGSTTDPRYYAKITFEHNTKGLFSIELPLAQHGRIPGANPTVTESLDGFYLKTEGDAIRSLSKKSAVGKDLKINTHIENKSQQMLRALTDILDSNMMENEFSINPDKAIRRMQTYMNNLLEDAPLAEGTVRDSFKAGRLITQDTFTKNQVSRMNGAYESMQNVAAIGSAMRKGEDVVNITFDFETISRDLPGPEWMARDEYTQLTKAGVKTSEFRNGKMVSTGAQEFVSDHGYYKMKQYGWTEETADWLRRELGPKSKDLITPDQVGEAWGQQIRRQAKSNALMRNGTRFRDNNEFAEHIGQELLKTVRAAAKANKKVFFTTKNGSQFDLHLLKTKAPKAWNELRKYAQFIDVHDIAYYRKIGFGGEGSLALNKIIMRMMSGAGAEPLNIDRPKQVQKALDFFRKRGNYIIGDEMMKDWAQKGYLSQAHSSPVADTAFTDVLLLDEVQKYMSGENSYKNLSDLHKFLVERKKIMGLDESFEEARFLERGYTIHGMQLSAAMLGQGQIAKQMMSMISPNHIIPFSDNNLTKQWDQFFMGIKNRPSDSFLRSSSRLSDIRRRQEYRKYFRPSFVSQGEIDATSYLQKADSMRNEFSHHVFTDTVFTFNSWRGQEGYNAFSEKALANYQFNIEKNIDLTSAKFISGDVHISKRILELEDRIQKKAKELAHVDSGGQPGRKHYELAAKYVTEEMDDTTRRLPRGSNVVFAQGDRKFVTAPTELDGVIRNVLVSEDVKGNMKLHAQVLYTATGSDFQHTTFNYRSLLTKSTGVIDKWLSLGIAMGGAEHVATADFIEKGYVGVQKQALVEKIFDRLIDQYENAQSSHERTKAKETLEKISKEINSRFDTKTGTIIHNPEIDMKFKNITDPTELAVAKKFIGNIDMNITKLNQYMVDAGIVWDKQKATNWYRMWANSDVVGDDNIMKSGRKNINQWIEATVKKATEDIDAALSSSKSALSSFHREDLVNIKQSMKPTLQTYFLPELDRVDERRQPMFLEPIQKWMDRENSPFIPGFRHRDRGAIYNVMKGRQPKPTNLKLRGNLLSMVDLPFTHVTKSTIDHLKQSRRFLKGDKFTAARQTLDNFRNVLMSRAMTAPSDLTLEDITLLLDNTNGLDLKELERMVGKNTDQAAVAARLTSMLEEEGRRGEDIEKTVKSILDELQNKKLADAFADKNSNFVSRKAIEEFVNMGKKKGGVLQLSKRPELGGSFEFKIGELLTGLGFQEEEVDAQSRKLLETFRTLKEQGMDVDPTKSIVESIDPTTGTVKLKKLVMHADASPQNVAHILNPQGGRFQIGTYTSTVKSQKKVLQAMKHYQEKLDDIDKGRATVESMTEAETMLKKQYLNYFVKGFMMDSSSVYARASELAPRSVQTPLRGAADIIEKAIDIQRRGGFASFGSEFKGDVAKADDLLNRLVKGSKLMDVYVTDKFFNNFEVEIQEGKATRNIKAREHLARIFGPDKAEEVAKIMRGEEYLYGYMTRHPNVQSGTDAMLDMRLNIIPTEVAEFLGMNANEAQVHAQYTKLFGADFDGDTGYFVLKSLENAKSLQNYSRDHSAALSKALNSIVEAEKGVMTTLRDKAMNPWMIDIIPGKGVLTGSFDKEGNFVSEILDINSEKATQMFENGFVDLAENIKTLDLHSAGVVTADHVLDQVDRVGYTQVSKNIIGLMTNTAYTRARQLMQAGLVDGDSVAAKELMGNLAHGYLGVAQTFISLAKHPKDNFRDLAKAVKVLTDPMHANREAKESFKNLLIDQFGEKGQERYQQAMSTLTRIHEAIPAGTTEDFARRSVDSLDLMREGTNIADVIMSSLNRDMDIELRRPMLETPKPVYREFAEEIGKRFKLDSSSKAIFKKSGRFAAIGAAAFLALNFFRPNQLSNSSNPLDAFTDLGTDIDGSHNAINSSLELERSVPLDMVNASFSKEAFIKLNKSKDKKHRSDVIMNMLNDAFENNTYAKVDFRGSTNLSYSNYTTYIPSFGSSQLDRKSKL